MRLSSHITRLPRAFQPDLGQETLSRLPALDGDLPALIAGTAGSSPYLKSLIEAEAAWLPHALDDVDAACDAERATLQEVAPGDLKPALRRAKRRLALIAALADLAGAWSLEQVTGRLSDFASEACDLVVRSEIAALIARGKLPGLTEEDAASAGGLCVLAMGKMGAGELNYSSDIDLICLFDETRFEADDFHTVRQAMVRATRNMCAMLSDRTADGYVFRTDLRLRPDPAVTPVCIAMEAAERYYESVGRTWERAAYIKARPAAGDVTAGTRFLATLKPFIWRRHLDFAAIQDAHDMRLRIRESKGLARDIHVPGHDMKLGRGGIREIEFFTQTRQLIAGGRDPDLRPRGTVAGLAALSAKGWTPEDVSTRLTEHYRAHREVEHRIQMVHDAQTHQMPKNPDELERIACLMGCDVAQMQADIQARLREVHTLTEGFFAPDAASPGAGEVEEASFDTSICLRWNTSPALRSQRAQEIFQRLRPELMARLARTARPEEALRALDGFLSGLPAGVQVFSLFEANPQLIDLLIDIVGISPALAGYLSRNAQVFDAVIGGDFFSEWPGVSGLSADLTASLARENDYENQLDTARRWSKEWHFRVGVHHLRSLITASEAGRQYADLAEAVIQALLPKVEAQFAAKHGLPPGRGAVVVGMGSLGARQLNASSDLDLIVIYDPGDQEFSEGKRPLAARTYYARLTQALITALSAPMSEGRLYEVDMRLRPSGNQGPVATSLASFRDYQQNQAWVWEHLALTRARVVGGGSSSLAEDFETFRFELLSRGAERAPLLQEVQDMRARIAEAKGDGGPWDAKTGAGRMQDIELLAQAGALLPGAPSRNVAGGLKCALVSGLLAEADAAKLSVNYDIFWSLTAAMRLLSAQQLDPTELGKGAGDFLCRATGYDGLDALRAALETAYAENAHIIDAALLSESST
ncbi:MAG: glutamine-synthetase adenylyltransferase [Arenibacterium sp.]